jgi:hypothetical protein
LHSGSPMQPVEFLQSWYQARSDGSWERTHGITIETLDSPGWLVTIDLEGTPLEDRPMPAIDRQVSQRDWLICEVSRNGFRGQGDPDKLLAILEIFKAWAEAAGVGD